jgi:hypothetical protein
MSCRSSAGSFSSYAGVRVRLGRLWNVCARGSCSTKNRASCRREDKGIHTDSLRGAGLCFSDESSVPSESAMGNMLTHEIVEGYTVLQL